LIFCCVPLRFMKYAWDVRSSWLELQVKPSSFSHGFLQSCAWKRCGDDDLRYLIRQAFHLSILFFEGIFLRFLKELTQVNSARRVKDWLIQLIVLIILAIKDVLRGFLRLIIIIHVSIPLLIPCSVVFHLMFLPWFSNKSPWA